MDTTIPQKNLHGVLLSIADKGVLIIGEAGVGKSSLAIELLYQGHHLIADDSIEIDKVDQQIIGKCPPLLNNILHSRELGLISIPDIFGENAWQHQHRIDCVVSLQNVASAEVHFSQYHNHYTIANIELPLLILNTQNPASLSQRLLCWLKMQSHQHQTETQLMERQQKMMAS